MKKTLLTSFSCLSVLQAAIAVAQVRENDESEFSAIISIEPSYVENATATSEEDAQVDETQIVYNVNLNGDWTREFTELSFLYDVNKTQYLDDTQPDENYWVGESTLRLGNNRTFYGLDLTHSVRRVLIDPSASPLLQTNNDSRNIVSIAPMLRFGLGAANTFALSYNYLTVDFKEGESNDSTRQGFDLFYIRHLTPTRNLTVVLGERQVEYDISDFANYDTRFVSVGLDVERRYYNYELILGYTELDPLSGEKHSSPTMDFEFDFLQRGNEFTLFANRAVTDASMGNGNTEFFTTEVSFDSSLAERDQIERTSMGLGWRTELVCSRCDLSFNVGLEKAEYVNLSVNDTEQTFVSMGFTYEFARSLLASTSFRDSKTSYTDDTSTRPDVSTLISRFDITYILNRDIRLAFLFEHDKRESDGSQAYTVKTSSLSFSYEF